MILDKEFYGDMRVENEVMALTKAGFNVFVYSFSYNGKDSVENFHSAAIVKFSVSKKIIWKLRGLTNTIFNFYPTYLTNLFKKRIKNDNINVLHIHDLFLLPVGLKLKKIFPEIKLVGDLHENYVEGLKYYKFANTFPGNILISIPKWEKSEIEWCKKYDHIITVIDEAVERYAKLGVPKNKINVVANYVNSNSFLETNKNSSIEKKESAFSALYIGGFDIHRGLESVVKAIPKIIEEIPNFKLILVGRGRNEQDLKNIAEKLNVSKHISFEGFQKPKFLPKYIKSADVCLIPHLKTVHTDNTIPHKLFHYMILGKPVLASNCNPIERIIKDAKAGLIYRSNNEKDFAEKFLELYKNPQSLIEMGENGIEAVKTKYNWEQTSENLINLYKKIDRKK